MRDRRGEGVWCVGWTGKRSEYMQKKGCGWDSRRSCGKADAEKRLRGKKVEEGDHPSEAPSFKRFSAVPDHPLAQRCLLASPFALVKMKREPSPHDPWKRGILPLAQHSTHSQFYFPGFPDFVPNHDMLQSLRPVGRLASRPILATGGNGLSAPIAPRRLRE